MIRAWVDEYGLFVAGTENREKAAGFLATWHDPECCSRPSDDCYQYGGRDPRSGVVTWMRTVPGCPEWCGGGHSYHYHDAVPHSRGAFPVVAWSH